MKQRGLVIVAAAMFFGLVGGFQLVAEDFTGVYLINSQSGGRDSFTITVKGTDLTGMHNLPAPSSNVMKKTIAPPPEFLANGKVVVSADGATQILFQLPGDNGTTIYYWAWFNANRSILVGYSSTSPKAAAGEAFYATKK